MKDNGTSVRLSDEFRQFIKRMKYNRIKADVDSDILSTKDAADILVKYFKLNNDSYIKLVNMEIKNDWWAR